MATDRAPSFSIQTLGGAGTPTAVVAVTGRLDASSQKEAEAFLSRLAEAGTRRLVLDCSGLDFVSSAGLRAILAAVKWTRPHGGGVTLSGASPAIRQLVQIAGLEPLLELVTSSVGADGIAGA